MEPAKPLPAPQPATVLRQPRKRFVQGAGRRLLCLVTCGVLAMWVVPAHAADSVIVKGLRCGGQVDPVGVDQATPSFAWRLSSRRRGVAQSAYQLLVASAPNLLQSGTPDLWDSGRVESELSQGIDYGGRPLRSTHRYYWTVRVWDEQGQVTAWSQPATVVTGLLTTADWQAKWIAMERADEDPLPIFRRSVRLDQPVEQAMIHICGLGHYELRINGQRVGTHEMDPGWTNYRKSCLYSSYDVTGLLKQGQNAIGVMLGNGMYNVAGGRYVKFTGSFGHPKLICQIHVTLADGSIRVIASDDSWKCSAGPITFSCIYGGEDYDARREQAGWDRSGFDDGNWSAARICPGPGGHLVAQTAPAVQVADTLKATAIMQLDDGRYEVDCGVNLSARPFVKVTGKAGAQLTVTCAEQRDRPWPGHSYRYTLKGEGEEIFRPRFTYFSFQYLYLSTGDADQVQLLEAGSDFLTSSASPAGTFQCSSALFNDIDAMITRSVRSNLHSVLTDCPHREKLGWLEVAHLMGPSILYRYDAHRLYGKICRDTTESQLDSGLVPDIAPEYTRFQGGFFESAEWGSACVQLPWLLYRWYGDRDILQQQYGTMSGYVRYLAGTRNAAGLAKPGLGDWYDWTPETGHRGPSQLTPPELPATAMLYDNARILARVASLLGRDTDRAEFQTLAERVRQDFQAAYFKPETKSIATGSQASLATALYYDLVPQANRDDVLHNLVVEVQRSGFRQTTGEVCFRMLLQTLADAGRSDLVFCMINRTDPPGYGHMLKLGFKTLSERWDRPGSSMNHCMFGHAQEWFHKSVIGIDQAIDSVGFRRIVLRPEPVGDLTSAAGYHDCVHGRIESRWKIEDGRFHWHIVVPANTTAEVHVPAAGAEQVLEGNTPVRQVGEIKVLHVERRDDEASVLPRTVLAVGSGQYRFSCPIAQNRSITAASSAAEDASDTKRPITLACYYFGNYHPGDPRNVQRYSCSSLRDFVGTNRQRSNSMCAARDWLQSALMRPREPGRSRECGGVSDGGI